MKTKYDGRKISKYIHKEDLERMIIGATDLWEDISDNGDGDYDEGTLVLSEEGEVVRDLIIKLLNQKQPEEMFPDESGVEFVGKGLSKPEKQIESKLLELKEEE
jgi:hypothetical protein